MRIIPAIDIIDGKCVRLTKGDYSTKKIYNEDPLEVALTFEAHGIEYLHLVDLDGARGEGIVNHRTLEAIASRTSLKIDFGGGLKRSEDVKMAFECGATQITGGSIAIKDPETFLSWVEIFGGEKVILGADIKNGKIAISGWSETSTAEPIAFINNYLQKGLSYVICTDISKDGMLKGPAFRLYEQILNRTENIALIASGGIC